MRQLSLLHAVAMTFPLFALAACNVQSGDGSATHDSPAQQTPVNAQGHLQPTNQSSAPVVVNPRVHVLSSACAAAAVVTDDAIYVPESGNEDLLNLAPGDVLVGASGWGFLRKVAEAPTRGSSPRATAVKPEGLGDIVIAIKTTAASLVDAFTDADFNFSIPISALNASGAGYVVAGAPPLSLTFSRADISLQPAVSFRGAIHEGALQWVEIEYNDTLSVDDELTLEAKVNGAWSGSRPVWQSAPIPIEFAIGPVPILSTLRFSLVLSASAAFDAEASTSFGEHCDRSRHFTMRWDTESGWTHTSDKTTSCSSSPPSLNIGADLALHGALAVRAEWDFVGLGGLNASVDGHLDLKAMLCEAPAGWTLTSGYQSDLDANFAPFGVPAGQYSTTLFSEDTPLASGSATWPYRCPGCAAELSGEWDCMEWCGTLTLSAAQSGDRINGTFTRVVEADPECGNTATRTDALSFASPLWTLHIPPGAQQEDIPVRDGACEFEVDAWPAFTGSPEVGFVADSESIGTYYGEYSCVRK